MLHIRAASSSELEPANEKEFDVRSLGNLLARVDRALFHTPYYTVLRFAMSRRAGRFV